MFVFFKNEFEGINIVMLIQKNVFIENYIIINMVEKSSVGKSVVKIYNEIWKDKEMKR